MITLKDTLIPVSTFIEIEPWLTTYFAYERSMIESSIDRNFCAIYKTIGNYKQTIGWEDNNKDKLTWELNNLQWISFEECDVALIKQLHTTFDNTIPSQNQNNIFFTLCMVTVLYYKHKKLNITRDFSSMTIDELERWDEANSYFKHIRPEMLKLQTLLKGHIFKTKKMAVQHALDSPRHDTSPRETEIKFPKPIRIEWGMESIEINNTAFWFTSLLEEYLYTYLGVESKKEAEQELKEIYSNPKGRKSPVLHDLIMMGTYRLLMAYSGLKPKSKVIKLTLDFLELLDLAEKNDDENNLGSKISYLEKQGYKPKWDIKPFSEYKTSPNNQTPHLW